MPGEKGEFLGRFCTLDYHFQRKEVENMGKTNYRNEIIAQLALA